MLKVQLFVSVSFAILMWPVPVLVKFLFEHVIYIHGGACQAACVQDVEYDVDEAFCYFLFCFAFFPSVTCFA
jgi:hypothetical protein